MQEVEFMPFSRGVLETEMALIVDNVQRTVEGFEEALMVLEILFPTLSTSALSAMLTGVDSI